MIEMLHISVIIPTLNHSKYLRIALNSLLNQSLQKTHYEIIVIDNGSIDNTKKIVQDAIKVNPNHKIRYFYEDVPGLLSGRHLGSKKANGELLVFIDEDIIADTNWLSAINETFKDPSVMLVGGKSLPNYEVEPPRWLEWFWNRNGSINICSHLSLLDYGDELKEIDPYYVWGLNFSIRKSLLFELGGFHPDVTPSEYQHFQGDGESGLTIKAKEKGFKAIYQPEALVHHQVPAKRMTYEYFDKRYFYQGICDSFTYIRTLHGKYALVEKNKKNVRSIIPEPIKKSLWSLFDLKQVHKQSKEELELRARFKKAYQKGYDFHQTVVKDNPKLLEWVLKDDYLDYQLPQIDINLEELQKLN